MKPYFAALIDFFKKFFTLNRKDIEHEFLPDALEVKESPPSPAGRIIIYGICAILTIAIIWSCIAKIDEVAVARGKLIPNGKIKLIQPAFEGVVTAINVVEGQKVKAGEVLVELDPLSIKAEFEKVSESLQIAKAEKEELQNELNSNEINTRRNYLPTELKEMYANLRRARELHYATKRMAYAHSMEEAKNAMESSKLALKESEQHLEIIRVEAHDRKSLVDMGGISREDYNRKQRELITAENEINTRREAVEEHQEHYMAAASNYELVEYELKSELLKTMAEKEKQIVELEAQYIKAKKAMEMTKLVSPVDGEVHGLALTTIGGVVKPAETVLTVVPDHTPLIMEAMAENKDIGFIDNGYEAEIKLDTYPFQRYGVIKGTVVFVSPDAVEDEKLGPIYKVKVELDMEHLPSKIEVYPGMSGSTEIKTNKKRVIDFFLDPLIKYADESLGLR